MGTVSSVSGLHVERRICHDQETVDTEVECRWYIAMLPEEAVLVMTSSPQIDTRSK